MCSCSSGLDVIEPCQCKDKCAFILGLIRNMIKKHGPSKSRQKVQLRFEILSGKQEKRKRSPKGISILSTANVASWNEDFIGIGRVNYANTNPEPASINYYYWIITRHHNLQNFISRPYTPYNKKVGYIFYWTQHRSDSIRSTDSTRSIWNCGPATQPSHNYLMALMVCGNQGFQEVTKQAPLFSWSF